jgi:hypothetical protein
MKCYFVALYLHAFLLIHVERHLYLVRVGMKGHSLGSLGKMYGR